MNEDGGVFWLRVRTTHSVFEGARRRMAAVVGDVFGVAVRGESWMSFGCCCGWMVFIGRWLGCGAELAAVQRLQVTWAVRQGRSLGPTVNLITLSGPLGHSWLPWVSHGRPLPRPSLFAFRINIDYACKGKSAFSRQASGHLAGSPTSPPEWPCTGTHGGGGRRDELGCRTSRPDVYSTLLTSPGNILGRPDWHPQAPISPVAVSSAHETQVALSGMSTAIVFALPFQADNQLRVSSPPHRRLSTPFTRRGSRSHP